MVDFSKYSKDNLSIKEEIELFRIFNGEHKKTFMNHTNHIMVLNEDNFIAIKKNFIVNKEKGRQFVESQKKEK